MIENFQFNFFSETLQNYTFGLIVKSGWQVELGRLDWKAPMLMKVCLPKLLY